MVVAGSTDPEDEARKTVTRHGLTFPVAYGLDLHAVSAATGAFADPDRGCIHSTDFLLRPDGNLAGAVYSTGPVGRYTAPDVIGLIKYLAKSG